jgi:uncharacterized protein (TIGR02145 family)
MSSLSFIKEIIMNRILLFLAVFCTIQTNAQTYLISFTGTGASTTITSVKVENLTRGTSINVPGGDILRLSTATGIDPADYSQSSGLKIYPNPITDNSIMEFTPPLAGDAVITVVDMAGRPVARTKSHLENFRQDFRLSGINKGIYLINVKGNNYRFSGKLLSNGISNGTIKIEKINSAVKAIDEKAPLSGSKGIQAYVDMTYYAGERLKLTGISGNYSTVKIDIPVSDKTITFNFTACTDGDNNNYPVVAIGSQIWMAENLKTTRYSDNTPIPLVAGNSAWSVLTTPGCCWFNNDEAAYKDVCGAMYNWYSVNVTATGGKNICPTGWHVPSDLQWSALIDYMTNNGYGVGGSGNDVAKSIAASIRWTSSTVTGTPGNDLAGNNSSGFTALPSVLREGNGSFGPLGNYCFWWSTTESITDFAWGRQMSSDMSTVDRNNVFIYYGAAVRCLKD